MVRIFFFLFCFIGCAHQLSAQFFPKEGAQLCYRLIGFSFPAEAGVTDYKIEVAIGSFASAADFEQHITTSVSGKKNRIIAEMPYFGSVYTWRTTSYSGSKIKSRSQLRHFNIKITPDVDTNITRLRIIKPGKKHLDGYVFIDGARALYDMNGKPVWFLPGTDSKASRKATPRDMKATRQGTITFITNGDVYEVTYGGNIRWQSNINNPGFRHFHHEFTRLGNGHYMGLLSELSYVDVFKLHAFKDSIAKNAHDSARYYQKAWMNNIVEYDEKGKLIWQWNGYDYLKRSDVYGVIKSDSLFDVNDLHDNAFFFDEKNKAIYLSFRNINRVIKIGYPHGNVLNTYGPEYKPGLKEMHNELFCGQHSCRIAQNGNLYLFNNNICGATHIPTVARFTEPLQGGGLKKVWEYQCLIEDKEVMRNDTAGFISGGDVLELEDQSIFVSMGIPYCKLFIVDIAKHEEWSAIPEKFDGDRDKWMPFSRENLYRASFVSRKQLEEMIWNAEKYEPHGH